MTSNPLKTVIVSGASFGVGRLELAGGWFNSLVLRANGELVQP